MTDTLEILLATAGWFGSYAALAGLTGHFFGRCREPVDEVAVGFFCILAPLGLPYALGRYLRDRAQRASELAEAEHRVHLAALGRQADEIAKF